MADGRISRRQFAIGVAASAAGVASVALGAGPASAAASGSGDPNDGRRGGGGKHEAAGPRPAFFDQTTLWDAGVGPLVNYHVHGLAVLDDDTIIAMTEGRYEVCDAGPRDLLARRSTDGGETWGDTQTVVASVDGQSWGNPTLVVDRHTGEIFLFYALSLRLPENTTCSGDSADLYMVSSRDKGITWSEPTVFAGLFDHFPYDWALHSPGPGHGIQLDSGRLLLNIAHRRVIVGNSVTQRFYGVAPIYSDDHGRTWQTTAEIPVTVDYPMNEARVVQRDDGSVLINGRNGAGGTGERIIAISNDRGLTWSPAKLDGATGVFNSVDASLVRYTGGPGSGDVNRMLFSRPDSPARFNMTVSVSYDEGYSLRYSRVINPNRGYYSDLARLSDGTIVLLYGCDGDNASAPLRVNVARFNLEWLTQGRDSLATGPRITEKTYDLGRNARLARRSTGILSVVKEPTARDGARSLFTPGAVGDYIEFPVTVPHAGNYEIGLRYYRPAAGGLVTVTIDGDRPHNCAIDLTAESVEGYDVLSLGRTHLRAGRHDLRFTLAAAGRGGGQLISVDELSLVAAQAAADVREEITMDNAGLGYAVVSGTWAAGTGVAGYYGSNYSSHAAGTGTSVVRWQPAVPGDGQYEVRVSYTPASNRATNAPYTVNHAGGATVVPVNQVLAGTPDPRGGTWVSLGVFPFQAGLGATIELSDQANGFVIADAIRLLRQD
jgi:hypothetical protein